MGILGFQWFLWTTNPMEMMGLKWTFGKAAPKDEIPALGGFPGRGKGLGKAETEEQMDKLPRSVQEKYGSLRK